MHCDYISPVRVLSNRAGYNFSGGCLACGCDSNLDVSTLLELHFVAIFVRQRVFDAEISIPANALVDSNLSLFRLFPAPRRDDFGDRSRHTGACPFWNSACIQFPFHYSRGFGHPRPRHFSFDAGACCVERFLLWFLVPHAPILAPRLKPYSLISHSCEICGSLIYWIDSTSLASAFSRP